MRAFVPGWELPPFQAVGGERGADARALDASFRDINEMTNGIAAGRKRLPLAGTLRRHRRTVELGRASRTDAARACVSVYDGGASGAATGKRAGPRERVARTGARQ
jgi:hypothetical protein